MMTYLPTRHRKYTKERKKISKTTNNKCNGNENNNKAYIYTHIRGHDFTHENMIHFSTHTHTNTHR